MSYLLDKRIRNRKIAAALGAAAALLLLFYLRGPIYAGLSAGAGAVFRPVISFGNGIGERIANSKSFFASKNSLLRENEELRAQLDEANSRMGNYRTVSEENEELKEALGRGAKDRNLLLASILSKPRQSVYGTLLVDAGTDDGIRDGGVVFAYGDLPIGRIAEAGRSSSKVVLFSNPGEKTEAVIGGAYILLIGRGGGNFEVETPRDFPLEKGKEAVLPGITPYVIARVDSIISDPRDSFQKALLASPVNAGEIKFVQIER